MEPRVSVLVLNYNGQSHLADCFESLSALEDPGVSFELVLVDNGSSDDSCPFVARRDRRPALSRPPATVPRALWAFHDLHARGARTS
jgi:GT2 family glycosyltransferase